MSKLSKDLLEAATVGIHGRYFTEKMPDHPTTVVARDLARKVIVSVFRELDKQGYTISRHTTKGVNRAATMADEIESP